MTATVNASTDLLRRVILWAGPGIESPPTLGNSLVVGLASDGVTLEATDDHCVYFSLPRIAEEVADVFRARGYTAEVAGLPTYW